MTTEAYISTTVSPSDIPETMFSEQSTMKKVLNSVKQNIGTIIGIGSSLAITPLAFWAVSKLIEASVSAVTSTAEGMSSADEQAFMDNLNGMYYLNK